MDKVLLVVLATSMVAAGCTSAPAPTPLQDSGTVEGDAVSMIVPEPGLNLDASTAADGP